MVELFNEIHVLRNLAANLKALALSLLKSDGVPLRAVNLRRLLRKAGPDRSITKSRCKLLRYNSYLI